RPGQGRRTAGERAAELVQLGVKRLVRLRRAPARLELVERWHERLGDVAAAVGAVQAGGHRAALTNARTFSWSLIPGAASSRDAAPTAPGGAARPGARTRPRPRPPARVTRRSRA